MDIYELVRGPFAWAAFIIFVAGCLYRIGSMLATGKKEPTLFPAASFKGAVRSILYGLIPFGSTYMRRQPLFTVVTVGFHLGVLLVPLFLLAHIVLWYESWEILWWSLPDLLADLKSVVSGLQDEMPDLVHCKVHGRVDKILEESVAKKLVVVVEKSETMTKVQEDMQAMRKITKLYREAFRQMAR